MGEQLELFDERSKTSEKTKTLGKEKTGAEARARPGNLRRLEICRRCGLSDYPWMSYLETGQTYYICLGCGAICERR